MRDFFKVGFFNKKNFSSLSYKGHIKSAVKVTKSKANVDFDRTNRKIIENVNSTISSRITDLFADTALFVFHA